MKLLMENWKKYMKEALEVRHALPGEMEAAEAGADPGETTVPKEKKVYAQYWKKADPDVEPGEELPPDIELDGSEEAMQVGFALSHLKLLLAREENPSEEEIIKAIHDGWDEGSYEYMNLQGHDED